MSDTLVILTGSGPVDGTQLYPDTVLPSSIDSNEAEEMGLDWPAGQGWVGAYKRVGDSYEYRYDEEPRYDGTGDAWSGGFAENH